MGPLVSIPRLTHHANFSKIVDGIARADSSFDRDPFLRPDRELPEQRAQPRSSIAERSGAKPRSGATGGLDGGEHAAILGLSGQRALLCGRWHQSSFHASRRRFRASVRGRRRCRHLMRSHRPSEPIFPWAWCRCFAQRPKMRLCSILRPCDGTPLPKDDTRLPLPLLFAQLCRDDRRCGPTEIAAVDPHAMHHHCQLARQGNLRPLQSTQLGNPHRPCFQC